MRVGEKFMNAVRYCIAVQLLLLPLSCAAAPMYRDVDGCKIAVPASWVAVKNPAGFKGCTLFTGNPSAIPVNGIMIVSTPIPKLKEDIQEQDNEVLDGLMYVLSKNPAYTVLDRSDTRLGGMDGKSVTVQFGTKGNPRLMRVCASAFIIGHHAYVILCECADAIFSKNVPEYAKSLATVQFPPH